LTGGPAVALENVIESPRTASSRESRGPVDPAAAWVFARPANPSSCAQTKGCPPRFLAVIEAIDATEEAVYNSLFTTTAAAGNGGTVEALPVDVGNSAERQRAPVEHQFSEAALRGR